MELDHVTKAFGDHVVLRDFTYHIARDDRVGIVGRNGAGKSTLLNLIAGKLTPDSGTVDWGETVRIGYFSQEGRELDPRQRVYDFIHEVAGQVKTREGNFSATQMMERFLFPTQLQGQPIGKLSGGERQRISLARAILKNAPIVVLDEATAFMDPENEEKMNEAIAEVIRGKTVLVIAHRLHSIVNADQICVLEQGTVADVGTHEELLGRCPAYQKLWQAAEDSAQWGVNQRGGAAQ
mgnify:CR=1 FL=1